MFYIIVFLSILLPLVSKNKTLALKASMCLLFILWGLQYEMVNDWPGNLERWQDINSVVTNEVVVGNRTYEPVFVFLVKKSADIGFFGWLIVCAIFELTVFYYLIKKYVPKQYYWISIFILMLRIDFGLLFINSNRQTLSLIVTMIATMILLYNNDELFKNKTKTIINSCIFILLIFIAQNIHSAAIFGYIILPIYFISHYTNKFTPPTILIANALFFLHFFFNAESLQGNVIDFFDTLGIDNMFSSYIALMDTNIIKVSIYEEIIYWLIFNAGLIYYNKFNNAIKLFTLLITIFIITRGFLYGNLGRVLQYIYVYLIILVPHIIQQSNNSKIKSIIKFRKPIYAFVVLYCLYSFGRGLQHEYYSGWNNFKTTITETQWK